MRRPKIVRVLHNPVEQTVLLGGLETGDLGVVAEGKNFPAPGGFERRGDPAAIFTGLNRYRPAAPALDFLDAIAVPMRAENPPVAERPAQP
jgi:hypothetical protein